MYKVDFSQITTYVVAGTVAVGDLANILADNFLAAAALTLAGIRTGLDVYRTMKDVREKEKGG